MPDILRVMDIAARTAGPGPWATATASSTAWLGPGKTMILGYRAEYLAKRGRPPANPSSSLCFNEPLGVKLASVMEAKGLSDRVHVRHFHKWCRQQSSPTANLCHRKDS